MTPSIYPDLNDTIRRASEIFEKMPDLQKSEKNNCNQIFMNGTVLKKEFMKRMPRKVNAFGHEFKMKQFFFLAALIVLFSISSTIAVVMWFTSLFDNLVYSGLILRNGTQGYQEWADVKPRLLTKVYVFNYTNVKDFEMDPSTKLHVEELGPYVYEEHVERVNIHFNDDYTVDYQEKRTLKFRPDLSKGKQSDKVVVPNVPLLAGASVNQYANFFQRMAFSGLLKTLSQTPFKTVPVHRFITGYDDNLYDLSKSYLKLHDIKPMERFGILTSKIGVIPEIKTIGTGEDSISNLGVYKKVDGEPKLNYWSTEECNSIHSTDGTMYPPKIIKNKRNAFVYVKDFCRRVQMKFEKEVKILDGKISAYKYVMPFDTFDSVEREPLNQCYCNMETGQCPLQGTLNVTSCNMGSPIFLSFPHFYNADPKLKQDVTGLKDITDPESIQTYGLFHPNMGYIMEGRNRIQANIQVKKSFGISQLNIFKEDIMLPLSWFDMGLYESQLPESFISIIYQTTFTVKGVEYGLKYGCLLCSFVTLGCILVVVMGRASIRERTSSMRPLKRRQESVEE